MMATVSFNLAELSAIIGAMSSTSIQFNDELSDLEQTIRIRELYDDAQVSDAEIAAANEDYDELIGRWKVFSSAFDKVLKAYYK